MGQHFFLDRLLTFLQLRHEDWKKLFLRLSPRAFALSQLCSHLVVEKFLLECDYFAVVLAKEAVDFIAIGELEYLILVEVEILA